MLQRRNGAEKFSHGIQPWDAGTLRVLSNAQRNMARNVASTGLFACVYDNINMMFRVSEQIMGRTGWPFNPSH